MGTNYIAPIWRMPRNANKDKVSNYSISNGSVYNHILTNSPYTFIQETGVFTFSAFFKLTNYLDFTNTGPLSALNVIASTAFGGSEYGFAIYYDNRQAAGQKQNLQFNLYTGGSTTSIGVNKDDPIYINDNDWHHVVVTGDGTNLRMYLDNSLLQVNRTTDTQVTIAGLSSTTSTRNLGFIGISSAANSYPIKGQLGQFLLYDYELTTSQRTSIYNNENPFAIGTAPQGYYELGSNSNPDATAGFPNISVGADSVFDFVPNDDINCGNPTQLQITGDITVSAWFKSTYSGAGAVDILSKGYYGNGTISYVLYLRGSGGGVGFDYYGGNNVGTRVYAQYTVAQNDGQWHHLVGVKSGSSSILYLDGEPVATGVGTQAAIYNSSQNVIIGANSNNAAYFDGEISNVQIWNTELSAPEVTTLYNNGQPLMTSTQPQEANLKAWYKLNQTANWEADTTGSWQIPDAVSAYPQSFDFVSAGGDRIMVAPVDAGTGPINSINGAITVAIWVKTTQGTVYEYAINRDYFGGSNRDWNLIKDNFYGGGDRMMFQLFNTSGSILEVRLTGSTDPQGDPLITMNDGKWHHIVGVYNGTDTAELYTDGILQGSATSSGFGNLRTNARTVIGGYNNSGNPFNGLGSWNGKLSNAQIWDTNLNATQVETLYNNGVPLTTAIASDNLKGWWKLNNNEIFDGTNWSVENQKYPASYESALNFPSINWIDVADQDTPIIDFSQPWAVSWWTKFDNTSMNLDCFWQFGATPSSGSTERVIIAWVSPTGNKLAWTVGDNWANPRCFYNVGPAINDGKWHHIVFTGDGTNEDIQIWVDNEPVDPTAGATIITLGALTVDPTNDLGRGYITNRYLIDTDMSNVAVFNKQFTGAEVTTLYNNGTPETSISESPVSWWKLDNLGTGIQDSAGGNNGTNNGATKVNTFVSTEAGISSGLTEQSLVNNNVSVLNGESSGMNTTNLVQSNLTRTQPFSNYSVDFDGLNHFGGSKFSGFELQEMSYSIWFRRTGNVLGTSVLITQGNSSNQGWTCWLNGDTIRCQFGQNNNNSYNNNRVPSYKTYIPDNTWGNIVATFDGVDTQKIYVNGELRRTYENAGAIDYSAVTGFRIGERANASSNFYGQISNPAVWNKALTADDALNIYNNGVPQDLSNFRITPLAWWELGGNYTYWNGSDLVARSTSSADFDVTGTNTNQDQLVGNAPGSEGNGIGTNASYANLKNDMYESKINAHSINMADYADGVTNPANSGRSTEVPSV